MISAAQLKKFSSLLQKKYRDEEHLFLIEGEKLIVEALRAGKVISAVMKLNGHSVSDELESRLNKKHIEIENVKTEQFRRLTDTVHPQGIVAVVSSEGLIRDDIGGVTAPVVLYLNSITDPGNMGTILRTCHWFGVKEVVLSKECVEVLNPKVLRSAMGAVFNLNFYLLPSGRLGELKKSGYKILVSDMNGEDISDLKPYPKVVIVMNNEAHGADNSVLQTADGIISIPGSGKAESLNVAIATGIILFKITTL